MEDIKFETPLCELAYKYRTDKFLYHTYTPVYFRILNRKKELFKKVLELGVGTLYTMRHTKNYKPGASLRMWRDFFPNAQIYGVDISEEAMFEEERIKTFLLDTTKKEDMMGLLDNIGEDLDLVVDDGPHNTKNQIRTALMILPRLKEGAIYIIEDVKDPKTVMEHLAEYGPKAKILEKVTHDNNLIIIRRKK